MARPLAFCGIALALLVTLAGCAAVRERALSLGVEGLPVLPTETVELADGSEYVLAAGIVQKDLDGVPVRMFAYNRQVPGPLLRVRQGSAVTVTVENALDMPTTVHWHGIRVENGQDGVPKVTQAPIPPGGSFSYALRFPDDGIYWYHPHVREDIQQELGLYGAILVEPAGAGYGPADIEEVLVLDDIKLVQGMPDTFFLDRATYALMGRFGNRMLVNGQQGYAREVAAGSRARFYLVNAAGTRVFNISIEGIPLRVVGGDSGLYERPFPAGSVVLAPAERAIVEASFPAPGEYRISHRSPAKSYALGTVRVLPDTEGGGIAPSAEPSAHPAVVADIGRLREHLARPPDATFDLTVETDMGHGAMMHGMMDDEPVEWEDTMPAMNAMSTSENTRWILRDRATGRENMDIEQQARVGDILKFRFYNDPGSEHPMQHPIHLHGQRFLVASVDGVPVDNLVWKDVVLVPKGATVDVLVEFTNPGSWALHCHIPEHMESGMMSVVEVLP